MPDGVYRVATRIAMGGQVRGHPLRADERTRALLARVQALRSRHLGLGLTTVLHAVGRHVGTGPIADGASVLPRPAMIAIVRRHILQRQAGGKQRLPMTPLASVKPAARFARIRSNDAGPASPALAAPWLLGALPRRPEVIASTASGHRMARSIELSARPSVRFAALVTPGISARLRHNIALPMPQHSAGPGFHRTVHQPRAAAPVGNVYLDKTLVGYHLAAAITAEQTRAAARPSISGSGFNSSMAALRPAGAGM